MNIIGKGQIFHHSRTVKKKVRSQNNIMLIDCKKFEQNNETIALNILYVSNNKKETCVAYESKSNCKRKNHVILLMITDGEKYHYLAVKILSRLLYGITSNHHGAFYCWVVYIHFVETVCLKNTKICVAIMITVVQICQNNVQIHQNIILGKNH